MRPISVCGNVNGIPRRELLPRLLLPPCFVREIQKLLHGPHRLRRRRREAQACLAQVGPIWRLPSKQEGYWIAVQARRQVMECN